MLQIAPPDTLYADRSIVDKHLVGAPNNFDIIVQCVAESKVRLRRGSENYVLRQAVDPGTSRDYLENRIAFFGSGLTHFEPSGAEMRVDGINNSLLRRII
ncbi:hypothetical protein FAIPA1_140021 [Frankia sp. AiPs1]